MTRNDLYAAAFRYKKTGLWKKLWDMELFAIRLANGEFGYISIMGHAGDYCALGLYIGDEGFDSFRKIANTDVSDFDEFQQNELLFRQKCLQLALENKDDLLPAELDEARAYAKANGIRFGGKNAFPHFIKYEPGYHPWKVREAGDIDALYQAAEVCILLGEALKTASLADFGILGLDSDTTHVPLLTVVEGHLKWDGYAPLPPEKEETFETVCFTNELSTARVKKLPKRNTWETEVVRLMTPVQDTPDDTPYYPLCLLVVESKDGFLLPGSILSPDEQHMEQMLERLTQVLLEQGEAPRELKCRDARTYALLSDFCERTGIRLRLFRGEMPMLDEAKYALLERMNGGYISDELTNIVQTLISMPDEVIHTMPEPVLDQFRGILEDGLLPEPLAGLLKAKLGL